ncbi:MAG: hypothetical protein ABEK04_01890 [Candidatus Nanohalobium sp.]
MGRTNATYRNHLDNFIESFQPFRRGLRKENKQYLDDLWEKAHGFAAAAAYMNSSSPGIPAIVSVMVGLQKDISELSERVERLEERVEEI